MLWTLRLEDGQFCLLSNGAELKRRPRERLSSDGAAQELDAVYSANKFLDWAVRYCRTVGMDNGERSVALAALLAVGREIAAWLDEPQWMQHLLSGTGDIHLDIEAGEASPDQTRAFLNVPWELLAAGDGFLALDPVRLFCVQRRLGRAAALLKPKHQTLALMFIAASPMNTQPVLDYEAEEAAILNATDQLALALTVEESGCLDFLRPRLTNEGPFEALHLSCHGDIDKDGPKLLLEDAAGGRALASAADVISAFGADKPGLVFLSACRTAEHEAQSAPLAIELLRAGVPAVLGWDGSVIDAEATLFARDFYADVANHQTPAHAAAKARQALLKAHLADLDRKTCRHWHMARLYVGEGGGGALTAADGGPRPSHRGAAYNAFLDKERSLVPVAGPMAFVGRRREAQGILRIFNASTPKYSGVLIHAIGGQGKSSLAARIADRMPRHRTVVIFRDYDAHGIFGKLLGAVPPEDREPLRERWEKDIDKGDNLTNVLEKILTGPCAFHDPAKKRQPVLLIIDDLERVLQDPAPGASITPVKPLYQRSLGAVLEAFDGAVRAGSRARLLLTSRYDFALPDRDGVDLAGLLHKVALRPFDANEQGKQQRAARAELDGGLGAAFPAAAVDTLLARSRAAAFGNPLIQATLTRLVLAEPDTAEPAIREMEAFIASGKTRDHAQLAKLFQRLTLDAYRKALSEDEAKAFRAMTLFETPVPKAALLAAAEAVAPSAAAAIQRFLRLGLIDPFEADLPAGTEFLASKLARPLFAALTEAEHRRVAKAALPELIAGWTSANGDLPLDARSLEAYRLAELAGDAEALGKSAEAAGRWLYEAQQDATGALALVKPAIRALGETAISPDPHLLRLGVECAERLGETAIQDEWLAMAQGLRGADERTQAMLWYRQAERLMTKGDFVGAEALLRQAEVVFRSLKDEYHIAATMGQIADILFRRGDLSEALRIRQEDQLLVYERLADVRSRAVTMGRIADILQSRGDLDEALRIRQEEQLPVYERLGDVRESAVTMNDIAEILFRRGDIDEALRVLQEELLPVFERLGDVRSRAVVMNQIAAILFRRGDLDEALCILQEKLLPVYERLGDVRSRAVTIRQIADIDAAQGRSDQAIAGYQEACKLIQPLGAIRDVAVFRGLIANILVSRGDFDEALRIHVEEILPVVEYLGDVEGIGATRLQLARIRLAKGVVDQESLERILNDLFQVYALAKRLTRLESICAAAIELGQVLIMVGAKEEARPLLIEARDGCLKLGQTQRAAYMDALLAQLAAPPAPKG